MIPISYNVRSLMVRKTTTFATAGGIALVVFVLAAAFMLSAGVSKTLVAGGNVATVALTIGGDAVSIPVPVASRSEGNIFSGEKRTEVHVVPKEEVPGGGTVAALARG